jgi:hypothetical protein
VTRASVAVALVALGVALAIVGVAAPASLVVQLATEPPGLDLTATSA